MFTCENQITTSSNDNHSTISEIQPTLANIQKYVFNNFCVNCHGNSTAQANLNLSEGSSFRNLVNVQSVSSSLKRVAPGDSENSYLLKRLNAADGQTVMPPNGKIDQQYIDLIKAWIDDGAQDN